MALTFRDIKGSTLTSGEVDNNFRHFTGSHEISGSLSLSGSLLLTDTAGNIGSESKPFTETHTTSIKSISDISTTGDLVVTASKVDIGGELFIDYIGLNYADDIDAANNGVALGGVYHTSGSLKVRIS